MQPDIVSELEFEFAMKPADLEPVAGMLIDFQGLARIWDDQVEEQVVANLKGHRLDLTLAREAYADLQELFDSISAEMAELGQHILNGQNCYVECCSRDEEEKTPCAALVYIDELVVAPAYRNRCIGTEMLKRMSQMVDMRNTLVALKAYPLIDVAHEHRTPQLKQQVKDFYRKLGFRHSGEHYMVKDARDCYAQRQRFLAEQRKSQPN